MGAPTPLKAAAIINGNAKNNKAGRVDEERQNLRRILRNAKIDITEKADLVKGVCQDYIRMPVDIVIISGGDGTIQNFMTRLFLESYRKFGKGVTPIEFARKLNLMALDPDSGLHLPAIYHRRRGTVNFYADMLGMKGDIERVAENISAAQGMAEFARAYIPILMIYSKENPYDLGAVQLMTLYGDAYGHAFFDEYYESKKKGKDPTFFTAMGIIARTSASAITGSVLDDLSDLAFGSNDAGRAVYSRRYTDHLMPLVKGRFRIDGKDVLFERNCSVMATIGTSLYGMKFFWRMPKRAEELSAYFRPRVGERPELLNAAEYGFHCICGNVLPTEYMKALPDFIRGTKTKMKGAHDVIAKRVEIDQEEPLRFITDGSRQINGNGAVIEVAYLQPFILLDERPVRP